MGWRGPLGAAAIAFFLLAGDAAADYLPPPEAMPVGTPEDRQDALRAFRDYVESSRRWLEPRIADHERRCGAVDPQDAALLADCQSSYDDLAILVDGYFSALGRYHEQVALIEDWLDIVARAPVLPPEVMRDLTRYQLDQVVTLLLRARIDARGATSRQALAEETLRLIDEITPPWARDAPPGSLTAEQRASLARHQLLETFTLLLEHRLTQRGDNSARAADEESERLLEEISPAWYLARDRRRAAAEATAETPEPGIDAAAFLAACGGNAIACLTRWPKPETRTDYLLDALHFANVYAAERGTPEDEKWWISRDYLEDWIRLNPDDAPAREALAYLEGLQAGATGGR